MGDLGFGNEPPRQTGEDEHDDWEDHLSPIPEQAANPYKTCARTWTATSGSPTRRPWIEAR